MTKHRRFPGNPGPSQHLTCTVENCFTVTKSPPMYSEWIPRSRQATLISNGTRFTATRDGARRRRTGGAKIQTSSRRTLIGSARVCDVTLSEGIYTPTFTRAIRRSKRLQQTTSTQEKRRERSCEIPISVCVKASDYHGLWFPSWAWGSEAHQHFPRENGRLTCGPDWCFASQIVIGGLSATPCPTCVLGGELPRASRRPPRGVCPSSLRPRGTHAHLHSTSTAHAAARYPWGNQWCGGQGEPCVREGGGRPAALVGGTLQDSPCRYFQQSSGRFEEATMCQWTGNPGRRFLHPAQEAPNLPVAGACHHGRQRRRRVRRPVWEQHGSGAHHVPGVHLQLRRPATGHVCNAGGKRGSCTVPACGFSSMKLLGILTWSQRTWRRWHPRALGRRPRLLVTTPGPGPTHAPACKDRDVLTSLARPRSVVSASGYGNARRSSRSTTFRRSSALKDMFWPLCCVWSSPSVLEKHSCTCVREALRRGDSDEGVECQWRFCGEVKASASVNVLCIMTTLPHYVIYMYIICTKEKIYLSLATPMFYEKYIFYTHVENTKKINKIKCQSYSLCIFNPPWRNTQFKPLLNIDALDIVFIGDHRLDVSASFCGLRSRKGDRAQSSCFL